MSLHSFINHTLDCNRQPGRARTASSRCARHASGGQRPFANDDWYRLHNVIAHDWTVETIVIHPSGTATEGIVGTVFNLVVTDGNIVDTTLVPTIEGNIVADMIIVARPLTIVAAPGTDIVLQMADVSPRFQGLPDGTFQPSRVITRAELIVIVARYMNITPSSAAPQFSDISGNWAEDYISAAARQGWVQSANGLEGLFRPNQPITRAPLAPVGATRRKTGRYF